MRWCFSGSWSVFLVDLSCEGSQIVLTESREMASAVTAEWSALPGRWPNRVPKSLPLWREHLHKLKECPPATIETVLQIATILLRAIPTEPLYEWVLCIPVVKHKLCGRCFSKLWTQAIQNQDSQCILPCTGRKKLSLCRLKSHRAPVQHYIQIYACFLWPIKGSCWHLSVGCNRVYKLKCSQNYSFPFIWECLKLHYSVLWILVLGALVYKMDLGLEISYFFKHIENCFLRVQQAEVKKNKPE